MADARRRTQADDESLGELFKQLADDGRAYIRAEIARRRARLIDRAMGFRTAAILGFAALMIAQATLAALLVGILLVIATYLGLGWATVITLVLGLAIVGGLGWAAMQQVRTANAAHKEEE